MKKRPVPGSLKYFFGRYVLVTALSIFSVAQMDRGTITGRVADESGHVVSHAMVKLTDADRNTTMKADTDNAGLYVFPSIHPGHYRMEVSAVGYRTVELRSLTVYTQDDIQQNFALQSGSATDAIVLMANGIAVDTTGSTKTVVERELVGELPLNGRSFQTLFQLTPGVVITPTSFASQGQFSVNGQRTDANYFIVDGVSANFAIAAGASAGQSAGGSLPALSVFGSTNSLISTDDVQEFAVLTSSYSAQFGRMPGAQVSIVSRSGTNRLSGTAFEYLRNEAVDANDWFANHAGVPRPSLRQNDFGGVLGGPLFLPKSFFFVSFENLELRQPTSRVSDVPSLSARNSAPLSIRPFLDAYPIPNGPDEGNGLALATYGFSNPSNLRTFSGRMDHSFSETQTAFMRFVHSVSTDGQRGAASNSLSTVADTRFSLNALTIGFTTAIKPTVSNDLRFNWSRSLGSSKIAVDNFAGARPLTPSLVFPEGVGIDSGLFEFLPTANPQDVGLSLGTNVDNTISQINVVDDAEFSNHGHVVQIGIDVRRMSPKVATANYTQQVEFSSISAVLDGPALFAVVEATTPVSASFFNTSIYAQDTWRPTHRFTATAGVRWEYSSSPAAHATNGFRPAAVVGSANAAFLAVAPQGSPLYRTPINNFAPRLGLACELERTRYFQSVFRGGVGIYYDVGNGSAGTAISSIAYPFSATKLLFGPLFPLSPGAATSPEVTTKPPFNLIQAFPSRLRTPYTYEWNLSVENAVGLSQTLMFNYVGAVGHSLLRTEQYVGGQNGVPPTFGELLFTSNTGYSNYQAFQAEFVRRAKASHLIASYSLGHSLDNVSTETIFNGPPAVLVNPKTDYGPSDFDIRHLASVGADYELPSLTIGPPISKSLSAHWTADTFVVIRSAPPVDVFVLKQVGLFNYALRPDLIPGEPRFTPDVSVPGDRRINALALSIPDTLRQGNLGRNSFRGFPLFQGDVAIHRYFRISERLGLQARVETFNLLNHPNFAPPLGRLGIVNARGSLASQRGFGSAQTSLAQGLQSGSLGSGFSPLYQIGGPRSVQGVVRIDF